jgi:hypothetical protein
LNKQLSKIALHALTTKEKGLFDLPTTHQMCENMKIHVKHALAYLISKL